MHVKLFRRVLDLIKLLPQHRWGVACVKGCKCSLRGCSPLPWRLAQCILFKVKVDCAAMIYLVQLATHMRLLLDSI